MQNPPAVKATAHGIRATGLSLAAQEHLQAANDEPAAGDLTPQDLEEIDRHFGAPDRELASAVQRNQLHARRFHGPGQRGES